VRIAVVFEPSPGDEQQDENDDQPLLGSSQDEKIFHGPA
jgi:hypothetical protein